jgi:hypothetical protein
MERELSDEALYWQIDAYFGYSRKAGSLPFEDWLESKDFTRADRQRLRVAFNDACNPERGRDTA